MFRFIIVYGVMGWGLSTALLFLAVQFLFHRDVGGHEIFRAVIAFPLAGILYGTIVWIIQTKRQGRTPSAEEVLYSLLLVICMAGFFIMMSPPANYLGAAVAFVAMVVLIARLVSMFRHGKSQR